MASVVGPLAHHEAVRRVVAIDIDGCIKVDLFSHDNRFTQGQRAANVVHHVDDFGEHKFLFDRLAIVVRGLVLRA